MAKRKSDKWFLDNLKTLFSEKEGDVNKKDVSKPSEIKDKIQNFNLYSMVYDAENKDTLFSWDSIPLIFPIGMTNIGKGLKMQAINIHFLTAQDRLAFINELLTLMKQVAKKKGFDPDDLDSIPENVFQPVIGKYMNAVYQGKINSAGKHIKVSFRSYFLNRIKSRLVRIPYSEYLIVAKTSLPKFNNASRSETYRWIKESYDRYKGKNWEDIY